MNEDDLLMMSGIQHFAFCRRQWALIHIERQWTDNGHTAEGQIFHHRAHEGENVECRGNTIIMRGLRVQSKKLMMTGICDVVEFHRKPSGITLRGYDGFYSVYPVEYKKGAPKEYEGGNADSLQLCAEVMALEEMLACTIEEGSLFYGETRHRLRVPMNAELRETVVQMAEEMQQYWKRGYTPKVKRHRGCAACSLKDICLPGKMQMNVTEYIRRQSREEVME